MVTDNVKIVFDLILSLDLDDTNFEIFLTNNIEKNSILANYILNLNILELQTLSNMLLEKSILIHISTLFNKKTITITVSEI